MGNFIGKNKLSLILGFLGVSFLIFGVFSTLVRSAKEKSSNIEIIPAQEEEASDIFIHISGAVQKPGLYKLGANARVNDALVAAGGLSADADRQWFEKTVNLAQKLSDGAKLFIPYKGSDPVQGQTLTNLTQIDESQGKININTASLSELDSLPGLGPVYSQRIIEYRNTHGLFSKIEDLTNVQGIGEKILEKFKDLVTVF